MGGGVEEGGTLLWETLQWHSHVPFIFPVSSFHTTLGFLASFPVTLYGKTLYSALLPLVDIGVQFRRFVIREWKQALKILKATLIILHLCNHGSVAWLKKQNKLDPCQFSEHLFYFMSYILICALFNPGWFFSMFVYNVLTGICGLLGRMCGSAGRSVSLFWCRYVFLSH